MNEKRDKTVITTNDIMKGGKVHDENEGLHLIVVSDISCAGRTVGGSPSCALRPDRFPMEGDPVERRQGSYPTAHLSGDRDQSCPFGLDIAQDEVSFV